MSTVYLLHRPEEQFWVETWLLRPLPALGFGRWVSSESLLDPGERQTAMEHSDAIIAVVSEAALDSDSFAEACELALACRTSVIPVFLATDLDGAPAAIRRMWQLPRVDESATRGQEL